MQLDEQLRQVAHQVPAPPPGDARTVYRRGLRRRRWRKAGRVSVVLVIVGVIGLGSSMLTDRAGRPDIADQPAASRSAGEQATDLPVDGPVITAPPDVVVSSSAPYPWVVAVSPGQQGRWCATVVRGTTEITDQVGQPCLNQVVPDSGLTWNDLETDGPERSSLSWGLAPATADQVVVEFADDTRRDAFLSSGEQLDAALWAIGHDGEDVQAVEALADGTSIAGATVLDGLDLFELLRALGLLIVALVALGAAWWWRARSKN